MRNIMVMWLLSGKYGRSVPKKLGRKVGGTFADYLVSLNFGALAAVLET